MCQFFSVGNGNANYEWSEREKVRANLELLTNYLHLKEVSFGVPGCYLVYLLEN